MDAVSHINHGKVLVDHHLAIELDAQEPGAHPGRVNILVRHVKVGVHEVRVLLDQSCRRVGVVMDLGGPRHVVQRRVLEGALHLLRRLLILRGGPGEVHRETRRLDVLGDVDDLHEPGYPQGDVLRRHPSEVERVESHLRRRLTDALRRDGADHFPWVGDRVPEAGQALANHPVESLGGQAILLSTLLAAEHAAEVGLHHQRCIFLRLYAQNVVARHHDDILAQLLHFLHDLFRVQGGGLAHVDVELGLSPPQQPV